MGHGMWGVMADALTPQSDTVRHMARALECDEDEAAFEDKVRKVANSSVQPPPSPKKPD